MLVIQGGGLPPGHHMAPQVKDTLHETLEPLSPIAESHVVPSAAPPAPARPASGGMRQDALSLEVPVRVHGSRVTEVVRGITPHTEPFEEQTTTMIVFPQGAVIRMVTPASAGQMLVITNIRSKQDAICRVVKVRANANQQAYIEVEFTSRQVGYWGVNFPSDPAAPRNRATPVGSSPAVAPPAPSALRATPEISWAPAQSISSAAPSASSAAPPVAAAPVPRPAAVPAASPSVAHDASSSSSKDIEAFIVPAAAQRPVPRPESAFISIGAQEKVQPAASATTGAKSGRPAENSNATVASHTVSSSTASHVVPREAAPEVFRPVAPAPDLSAIPLPEPPNASAAVSLSELRGDSEAAEHSAAAVIPAMPSQASVEAQKSALESAEKSAAADVTRRTFGSFTGGAAFGSSRAASVETHAARPAVSLGAALETEPFGAEAVPGAAPRKNWLLIAAAIGGIVVVAAAGALYLRPHAASSAPAASAPAISAPASPSAGSSSAASGAANPAPVRQPQSDASNFRPSAAVSV
ncbi:MAG: hypothetical protein WA737_07695, partial [Candidatus Acidiferrales bacterium]